MNECETTGRLLLSDYGQWRETAKYNPQATAPVLVEFQTWRTGAPTSVLEPQPRPWGQSPEATAPAPAPEPEIQALVLSSGTHSPSTGAPATALESRAPAHSPSPELQPQPIAPAHSPIPSFGASAGAGAARVVHYGRNLYRYLHLGATYRGVICSLR